MGYDCSSIDPVNMAHEQAAETLFNVIPPAIAPDFLEDYGLAVSQEQAQSITWEIVLLSTYWIKHAIQVGLPEQIGTEIWEHVQIQIRERWENRFGFVHRPIEPFFSAIETKYRVWDHIANQGGEPIAILTQVASTLESEGIIPPGEEHKLLVLLLDVVPMEEIEQAAAEIEEGFSPDGLPF
jgi:hypothetical protein